MPVLLFVYGTLRRTSRGVPHPLLRRARFIGNATVAGRLYDLGRYPALLTDHVPADRVAGELYRLPSDNEDWRRLDEYEGCDVRDARAEYRRESVTARRGGGRTVTAWCYVYNRSVARCRRIVPADYRAFQQRRRNAAPLPGETYGRTSDAVAVTEFRQHPVVTHSGGFRRT